ncbi:MULTISPECIES: DUF6881 domain-containing protein [unclassified Sphingopyxis]|uniref:DUF6881 domain-containing protein n=1 Tax=unclassified Sphingopyxis TaxID=2614943 RepID=UPI00073736B8|nr:MULTISPECIES: hypothetical protein [unclassified Sphingopyxis]KTE44300.1 hypothetical protein ATE62_03605 [Sphingopyxis sp. HIX]KTE85949.1 hypothetical protein ATE72_01565 [Sphingopyxis sp. HXXIV]
MLLSYYRCDWRHQESEDPVVIFYEVDAHGDVPRMIDIFSSGRRDCVSTADFVGRENEMPGINSLVEGDFRETAKELLNGNLNDDGITLVVSDHATFEFEWLAGK